MSMNVISSVGRAWYQAARQANFLFPTFSPPNCESFGQSLVVTWFVSVVGYAIVRLLLQGLSIPHYFVFSSVATIRFISVVRLTVSPRLHGSKISPSPCSISFPPPHKLKPTDAIMKQPILLATLACLILIVAYRARGFSSGAPEESCDSLTVKHTHVGSPAPGAVCDATCRQARQLRWIGNTSADSFIYNCNETYQCEFYISATEVTK